MTAFRPKHLSVSSVQLYTQCPARFKARYVDRLAEPLNPPMLFGTAFHRALEAEHSGRDGEREMVAAWNAQDRVLAQSGQSLRPDKTHALALLDEYKARFGGGRSLGGTPEKKFVLPFPSGRIPVPLLGYIDLVLPDEIREYKTTASTSWTETKAALAPQTSVYGWAVQRLYRRRLPVRYVIFRTDIVDMQTFVVSPSPDSFRAFETEAEAVWRAIVAGEYPGCGLDTCPVCTSSETKEQARRGPTVDWD